MKMIVCTGDSHTMGEGASCFTEKHMEPYNTAGLGCGTPTSTESRDYVNRLRTALGGTAIFHKAAELGYPMREDCAHITKSLHYTASVGVVLLQFAATVETAVAELYFDGALYDTITLETPVPRNGDFSFFSVPVHCAKKGEIELRPISGNVYLYAIEMHTGDCAVVRVGCGSCAVARFSETCFPMVEALKPAIVIAEAHTINDWLTRETPAVYEVGLRAYLRRIASIGAQPILLTVSPVMGEQAEPRNASPYIEFIEASRRAAIAEHVRIADAHAAFSEVFAGMTPTQQSEKYYHDHWHVNDLGHQIYTDTILSVLR